MNRIKYLTKKYGGKSKEEWRDSQKKIMAYNFMDKLKIVGTQKDEVLYILNNVCLKDLHRCASTECIILGICFYIKKVRQNTCRVPEDYSVCRENGLTSKVAYTIVCNLLNIVMASCPVKLFDKG